jgi:hypothetical protein
VTVQETDTVQSPPPGDPGVVDILRRLYADATAEADRLAAIGGHEREEADRHLARAADADAAAMSARAYAERWRRHLEYELGGPADLPGRVELPQPSGDNPYPQMRYCNGCGQPLRPATPEEMAAIAAGQVLPDNRRDCANCALEAADQQTPVES